MLAAVTRQVLVGSRFTTRALQLRLLPNVRMRFVAHDHEVILEFAPVRPFLELAAGKPLAAHQRRARHILHRQAGPRKVCPRSNRSSCFGSHRESLPASRHSAVRFSTSTAQLKHGVPETDRLRPLRLRFLFVLRAQFRRVLPGKPGFDTDDWVTTSTSVVRPAALRAQRLDRRGKQTGPLPPSRSSA